MWMRSSLSSQDIGFPQFYVYNGIFWADWSSSLRARVATTVANQLLMALKNSSVESGKSFSTFSIICDGLHVKFIVSGEPTTTKKKKLIMSETNPSPKLLCNNNNDNNNKFSFLGKRTPSTLCSCNASVSSSTSFLSARSICAWVDCSPLRGGFGDRSCGMEEGTESAL